MTIDCPVFPALVLVTLKGGGLPPVRSHTCNITGSHVTSKEILSIMWLHT